MMIRAEHSVLPRCFFYPYFDRLLRKNFSHFFLANKPPNVDPHKSLIITPNHFTWWDGFFILKICRYYIEKRFHLMMLEEQLSRYPYFRRLGAYSIDPGDTGSVRETLRYSVALLQHPDNLVVFYPQGKIESYDKRPVVLQKGIHSLIKRTGPASSLLITGFKINYYNEKHPEIIVRFGDYFSCSEIAENPDRYRESFSRNMRLLDQASYERAYIKDLFYGRRYFL